MNQTYDVEVYSSDAVQSKQEEMALCFGSWWEDEPMTADSRWYRFRKTSYKIVTHLYFENLVIFLILISTVTLVSIYLHLCSLSLPHLCGICIAYIFVYPSAK